MNYKLIDVAIVSKEFSENLPKVLFNWRKSRGISQQDLCKAIDMPIEQYSRYENGHYQPSLFNFYRIMSFYDFPDIFSFI